MTHHGNWCVMLLYCCSIVANLHHSFLLPSLFYVFSFFTNSFFASSSFFSSLLSSVSLCFSGLFLFPSHLLSASSLHFPSVYFSASPCYSHSFSLSYFPHQLLSRFQSVIGLLARLPASTTYLLCVRTCTTGSNRIPRMCVSLPAR